MIDREQILRTLERLRRQGTNDAQCEAKTCAPRLSADVWETVSAFANTQGGMLLLGIDERAGFQPSPAFDAGRIIDQFVEGVGDGNPAGARLTNPPRYEIARIDVGARQVVAISIDENRCACKPCFITVRGVASGSFKRVADKDLLLSATEIYELETAGVSVDTDRAPVPETDISDLDPSYVERYLALMASSRVLRGVTETEEALTRLNILSKQGTVRLAGLLALGTYPQQYFPALIIDVAHHPGLEKAEPGGPRFLDRVRCEGPLPEAIADAVQATLRNLRVISYIEGAGRHDISEIPEDVLREAIVNAVAHREYQAAFTGQAVAVDIYRDRVEITSPGGLWGGKTLENLADGTSRCRNSTLMKLLETLPSPHDGAVHAERQGSGIPFMMQAMHAYGLPEPTFRVSFDQFKVILRRPDVDTAPPLNPVRSRIQRIETSTSEPELRPVRTACAADETPSMRTAHRSSSVDIEFDGSVRRQERLQHVVSYIEAHAPTSAQELSHALDINLATIRRDLRSLLASGTIEATAPAQSKRRRYRVPSC